MTAEGKHWSDLSERTRGLIIAAAIGDGILKVVALIDIKRRPATEIRGPKWVWAPLIALVNSSGILPVSYFLLGRRRVADPRYRNLAG